VRALLVSPVEINKFDPVVAEIAEKLHTSAGGLFSDVILLTDEGVPNDLEYDFVLLFDGCGEWFRDNRLKIKGKAWTYN